MIRGFRCRETRRLFESGRSRGYASIADRAMRKLAMLDAATQLCDLGAIPGNRLETLKGDRAGQHSIRINDQFRICFVWTAHGPTDVEIVDYH